MTDALPPLSPQQWQMMTYIWALDGGSVRDVLRQAHADGHRWAYQTVSTHLGQCAGKGYLTVEKSPEPRRFRKTFPSGEKQETEETRHTNIFRPTIDRATAVEQAIDRFLTEVLRETPRDLERLIERARERLARVAVHAKR